MTKEDIIRTAFKVWGRDLYRTTSLTLIARELRVSKAALYRHFRDKDDLLATMYNAYFDECSAFIKESFDQAVSANQREANLIMMRTFAEYYIRNREAFVFSLILVFGRQEHGKVGNEFRARGIDFERLALNKGNNGTTYPAKFQLMVITTIFNISVFHHSGIKRSEVLTDSLVQKTLAHLETQVLLGLRLDAQRIAAMNYGELEKQSLQAEYCDTENNVLLRAVAEAVAEAGPWNASMEMVARRSGLSKSGLYAHFKSKQDMLGKLFITEYVRILNFAKAQVEKSEVPEDQLYLAIITIVNYLRSRPEILVAMDWIKTIRLDLGKGQSGRLFRIIRSIRMEAIRNYDQKSLIHIAQWILFMIVNTLAWWSLVQKEDHAQVKPNRIIDWAKNITEIPNESFRVLFRFIAMGLEGINNE